MQLVVSATSRPFCSKSRDLVRIVQSVFGFKSWSGQVRKNLACTGLVFWDLPVHSELLYACIYIYLYMCLVMFVLDLVSLINLSQMARFWLLFRRCKHRTWPYFGWDFSWCAQPIQAKRYSYSLLTNWLTDWLTDWLTRCSRVFPGTAEVSHLVKKFYALCKPSAVTSARSLFLS